MVGLHDVNLSKVYPPKSILPQSSLVHQVYPNLKVATESLVKKSCFDRLDH